MENLENIEENTMIKSSTRLAIMGWSICLIGALFYSYEYFLRIMPSVMSAKLMAHFNIEAGALGIFVAIYYWAYVPLQLPVGLLHDRFGPRRLLTFACLLCVVGTYMFGISHSIYIAATGRLFVGIGSAFAFVGVLKLASIWLPAWPVSFPGRPPPSLPGEAIWPAARNCKPPENIGGLCTRYDCFSLQNPVFSVY